MNPTPAAPVRHRTRRLGPARTVAAAIGAWILVAGPAVAASPSPPTAPSDAPATDPGVSGGFGNLEVWIDLPLPPDAPAGSTLPVGLMLWANDVGRIPEIGGLYLRLKPATGKARPMSAETRSDFPGHFLANVIVPKGGPGAIEVGISGQACTSDGTCKNIDFPFRIAGTGPPPGAPRSQLVSAIVHVPTGQVPTGQSMDIGVDVSPRVDWDAAALGLPDRMIVVATLRDHPDLATTELHADPSSPRAYRGAITIPDAGEVALIFAFPVNGDADDVIGEATTRVRVIGESVTGSAPPASGGRPAVAPASDQPPWLLIGAGLVAIVAAGFVIQRVFADL